MPIPALTEYTDASPLPHWLQQSGDARHLLASRELASGHVFFPPIPASSPLSSRYETIALSAQAALYSFTIIHPNKKANKPPFALVYADFPEQVRVFGRYEGRTGERPAIGQALTVAFAEDELGRMHFSFKPA
jgi:uncharacterized OB-fold protein